MVDRYEEDEIREGRSDLMLKSRYDYLLKNASGEEDDTLREGQSSHSQGMYYYHFRQSLERECQSYPIIGFLTLLSIFHH